MAAARKEHLKMTEGVAAKGEGGFAYYCTSHLIPAFLFER